jgi:hypothetical protein
MKSLAPSITVLQQVWKLWNRLQHKLFCAQWLLAPLNKCCHCLHSNYFFSCWEWFPFIINWLKLLPKCICQDAHIVLHLYLYLVLVLIYLYMVKVLELLHVMFTYSYVYTFTRTFLYAHSYVYKFKRTRICPHTQTHVQKYSLIIIERFKKCSNRQLLRYL